MRSSTNGVLAEPVELWGSRRRGFSLVELSVVIAVSSVIMSSMVVSLHSMYRSDRDARDDLAASAVLIRLSAQFRSDAHAARSVDYDAADGRSGHARLIMILPDEHTVEYSSAEGSIQRVARRGEAVIHRDAYRLKRHARAGLLLRTDQVGNTAAVVVSVESQSGDEAQAGYRIEALIGSDHSYAGANQ